MIVHPLSVIVGRSAILTIVTVSSNFGSVQIFPILYIVERLADMPGAWGQMGFFRGGPAHGSQLRGDYRPMLNAPSALSSARL